MAAGIGFYSLALTGTAVVLIALLVFRHVRAALLHRVQSDRFLVEVEVEPGQVRDMLDLVAASTTRCSTASTASRKAT